jgi:hypothetical protein
LPAYLPQSLALKPNELSIYTGPLTDVGLVQGVATVQKAFPALPATFYDVLIDRLRENGFSDERLADAIAHVIDNCRYPTPTIADFISFDRRFTAYNYGDISKLVDQGLAVVGETHKAVKLPNLPKPVWVHVNDIAKYNLKPMNE